MRFRHGIHLRAAVAWLLSPTQSAPLVYGRLMNVGTWRAPATSMATAIRRLHPQPRLYAMTATMPLKEPGPRNETQRSQTSRESLGKNPPVKPICC